jgi:hypothetical protein
MECVEQLHIKVHLSLERVGPHCTRARIIMRAIGIKIEKKLRGVFANAQIPNRLPIFSIEMLANSGVPYVVFLVVLVKALGNNSCIFRGEVSNFPKKVEQKRKHQC